ncbi:putative FH1/FH2 domain-containing protein 3 [Apostichopus japonicus]|uniref:Putative FH1/FH2 domain-containing protein 3 n=1 Tax=Stichopus japonicus TaxID=307972 RepID=A0A2G8KJC1_STIJA|nr:putative FH1/FH2 domain-containing protein 3 [Apostichopus japonicus]
MKPALFCQGYLMESVSENGNTCSSCSFPLVFISSAALGEIMLFMDGMNGIIEHNQAIQWLYSLLTMQYRLVVKSALKLLIVFVEYVETNATLFVKAVKQEDAEQNRDIGANFMNILSDTEQDSEITTYVMTLINKTLNYIPDQDTFYDMTDAFERQDIEGVSQRMCNKSNSDLDLVEQFKLYEYALKQEDGEADIPINKKMNLRKARRSLDVTNQRKSMRAGGLKATSAYSDISKRLSLDSRSSSAELENGDYLSPQRRRREQRRSRDLSMDSEDLMKGNRSDISASLLIVQPPSLVNQATVRHPPPYQRSDQKKLRHIPEEPRLSFVPPTATTMDQRRRRPNRDQNKNYSTSKNEDKEPPSIKSSDSTADLNFKDNVVSFRRRNSGSTSEEKQREEEEEELKRKAAEENQRIAKQSDAIENRIPVRIPQEHTSNDILVKRESQECQPQGNSVSQNNDVNNRLAGDEEKETEGLSLQNGGLLDVHPAGSEEDDKMNRKVSVSLRNTATVDQRIEKLRISSIDEVPQSPKEIDLENQGSVQQLQDQLTKQGSQDSSEGAVTNVSQLAKSLADLKNNLNKTPVPPKPAEEVVEQPTPKRKETVTDWMMVLIKNKRKLEIKDWDFNDLTSRDDDNVFSFTEMDSKSGSVPPPPPMGGPPPPHLYQGECTTSTPPPPMGGPPPPPPPIGSKNITKGGYMTYPPKGKKTIRLFWRQFTPVPETLLKKNKLDNTIWKSLVDVKLDTRKLETLFESRGKDFLPRKATDSQKKQFITVLNSKRSNAINIGLTVLPQPETIKQAVLHMDSLVLTKENVERLLSMAPTEEEIDMIRDAQRASPDTPLGSAEDFLMMLASVGALEARLKLWIFKIDYDNQEEEIAEHLADLKTGIDDLQKSKTFMYILAALRAVGNFLNGANVEGFHIEYLSKVSEVKDTSSSKQSLLFHLCSIIREQFPESTDFFSEIGSIKRCAKVDFDELETNLLKLEEE